MSWKPFSCLKVAVWENRKAAVSRASKQGEVEVTTLCIFVQTYGNIDIKVLSVSDGSLSGGSSPCQKRGRVLQSYC